MSNATLFEVATAIASHPYASSSASNTLVVIDTSVKDYEILAAGVVEGTVVVLERDRDGIDQVTAILRDHPGINSVHLVAHGAPGTLFLGNSQLNWSNCDRYADQLQQWFNNATDPEFSLLLYACNVAAGDAGLEFLERLQHYTGASIAASTTRIGNPALSGNWELDAQIGNPVVASAFDPETLKTYSGILISTVSIAATDTTAAETGNNTGNFRISLSAVTPTDLTINYSIATGTGQATNGTDYDVLSGTAVVLAGTSFVDVKVTPIDDPDAESAETVSLTLSPSVNYTLGTQITATVTITSSDLPPTVASPIADQSATEDAAFSFTFSATAFNDVDGNNTLTYSATLEDGTPLPGWLTFNAATRTFSGTPLNGNVGSINVKVTASDGTGSVSDTFALSVANTNDAPIVANAIADQSATEDANFSFVVPANSFTDVDAGDILTYSATLENGAPLPAWLTFNAASRTFSGVPSNSEVGIINVKVTASDGTASTSDTFALSVANTNDAPIVANAIADQSATEDANFSFVVPANSFTDVDAGDVLTYSATLQDGTPLPAWLTFNAASRTFSGVPSNSEVGIINVKVTASDGTASTSDTFALTVANTNDAPIVANAIADQSATEDANFSFVVPANSFTDVDAGDILTYSATLENGTPLPGWLTFNAATRTFSGVPSNSEVGVINVKVTASDGTVSVSDTFALSVANTNDAPIVANAIADQSATEDASFSFVVPASSFNDVDTGDVLTYSATLQDGTPLPGWLTFNAATRTFSGVPSNSEVGVINVKVTASDSTASVSDTFALTVINTNDAPTVANPIADQSATEDANFSFVIPANSFNDVDQSDSLIYTATLANGTPLPNWLTFNAATRAFSGTPTNAEVGAIDIKVTASDGTVAVNDTFALTVINTNDAPTVANAIIDRIVTEDTAFSFTLPTNTFKDVDTGTVLTYSATLSNGSPLPAWLQFNAATGTFSGTPTNTEVGVIDIKVTASDGTATVSDNFTLTVNNTNDTPTVANAIADQTATEDAAFSFTVPANSFSDVDAGDALTYSATLSNGVALPAWLTFNPATRTFSGTPTNAEVGTIDIKVKATDKAGATAEDTFLVTTTNTNDAPTVANAIADQMASEDVAFSFTVPTNSFSDMDAGDVLTYSAVRSDGSPLPAWLTFNTTTRTFSGTPTNTEVGSFDIKVRATDGASAIAEDTFTLTVNNTNDAPTLANAIADQTATEDAAFSFTVPANSFSDMDAGDVLTYSATLSNGVALPTWLTFNPATRTFSGTPTNVEVGTIDIKVKVTDKAGATAEDTFLVTTTNTNDAPTVANAIADQMASEDVAFSFTVPTNSFSDVDAGDVLTYSAVRSDGSPLPAWLTFNATTRTFSGTPSNTEVGSFDIKVRATDGASAIAEDTFTLTVNNTNDAPTLANAIADQTTAEDAAFSFTVPANSFSDVDAGDALTYSATLSNGVALPTWLTFDPATRTFSGTPTNAEVGSLNLKVKATDKAGATAEDTFFVTTTNTNDAPTVANAIADQTTIATTAFSLTAPVNTFNDVDGDTLTYSATLASNAALPAWLTFDAATRTFSGTPTLADVGNLSIRLTAADSTTSVSDLFALNVIANTAPTLTNPIADQTAPEDAAFSFTVPANTFSDADAGDKLTYTATLATGAPLPDWLTFDATTQTFSGTPTNDNIDSLNLKVAAIDRAGETVEAPFKLTVANVNDAPIISGTPLDTVAQDIPYSFTPVATDVDAGTQLTFMILNKPDWATFDPATGTLSGTPKNLNVGITKAVTIGVNDGVVTTNLPAFNLTVTNVNDSPVIGQALSAGMLNQTTFAAFPYSFKLPDSAFVDPDAGDKLTLSATQENGSPLPSWLKFNPRTLTFSGTPNIQSLSKLSLKVTATDGSGSKISQAFQLEVALPIGKTGIAVPDISFAKHRGSQSGIQRQGGDRSDTLRGAFTSDTLRGGGGDDLLIGGNGKLLLGTDRLFGGDGNDRLFGGAGNDYLDGGAGNDRLQGGRGRDLLLGGIGDDVLVGSKDADILVGGAGADSLNGGQGKDMFVFQQVQDGADTIVDFVAADDLIDLRSLFAQPQFSGITPYARYAQYIDLVQVGGNTEVRVDEDGSGDQTKFVTLATLLNLSPNGVTPRNFVIS